MDKLKILFLADHTNPSHAGTILDHIQGIRRLSRHRVTLINPRFGASLKGMDLEYFDVILIHYSIWILWETYLSRPLSEKIKRAPCLKAQFIQDEYRYVNMTVDRMVELGIDVLFSCVPEAMMPRIYGDPRMRRVRMVPVLTGYVPESFIDGFAPMPIADRPIDIGYRSRANAPWLGNLSREKILIADGVLKRAPSLGLKCDVSVRESDRVYGRDWLALLGRCRAVLGTASGASIVDFDGNVENATNEYLIANPWASYDEIFDKVLKRHEGNAIINTISPRVFEAAVTRSAQIMFESPYAGVIEPWVHYIPLNRDFSNMTEVAELIRDDAYLEKLTERTHADLVESGRYSYARLVRHVDDILIEEVARRRLKADRTAPSARLSSGALDPFSIAMYFYARISPLLPDASPYIRMVKLLLSILLDRVALSLAVAMLARDKGNIQQLKLSIPELGRVAILRRRHLRAPHGGRRLSIATALKNGIIYFRAGPWTENESGEKRATRDATECIAAAFAEGSVKRILFQARLPIEDRPEFFEGASPINSIYEFERMTSLGREFPTPVARLVAINVSSVAADGGDNQGGNAPI